jgi:hypothetical protein
VKVNCEYETSGCRFFEETVLIPEPEGMTKTQKHLSRDMTCWLGTTQVLLQVGHVLTCSDGIKTIETNTLKLILI